MSHYKDRGFEVFASGDWAVSPGIYWGTSSLEKVVMRSPVGMVAAKWVSLKTMFYVKLIYHVFRNIFVKEYEYKGYIHPSFSRAYLDVCIANRSYICLNFLFHLNLEVNKT